ncbi:MULTISPECIES: serine hydrolase domain-containing protein [unclassified Tenacibaculum]|uniref:serine hydrolase domain-containing protein n=1 Tax=unclassified Tenacibaculum TaxID=2635139 RepID=UPI001F421AE7|nr:MULTISPECIES: serine hydrolase [unclassified Tenacibaculum]MCF2874924.1 beta-lactamase family protein [Tenacibaculum sp. Cn5-1]MCF2934010.1 beta-lactamase family protein [Tenacibaculum sp. Cn5-34]MCG7510220.1 beta-lactamase family protein [Tenacibaculum sp. Cn5-46]
MRLNYYLVLIVCLMISNNTISFAQKKSEEIATGKLFFSKIDFQKSKITSKNYTNSFTLHKDKYLNIHFALDKPLIESLKSLAPNLTDDQLLNKGNFQFSIIVDGKKVHTENLNKGAGTVDFKTKKRKHFIPLMYPEQIDFWGWFMWMKFMKLSGGQDVLVGSKRSLTFEVRPYIKTETLKEGPVLAKGNITVEVAKIPVDESLIPIQKIEPNSGWELSKSTFNAKIIEDLNRKIAEKRFEDINGIVVIKDNKLLIEEYFNGETRNSLHDARSVGKSFASTVLGIAIKENYIQSENVLLKEFYDLQSFENYSKKKDSVTLKSLLTMSSGFVGDDSDYNSIGNEEKMYPTSNWVKFSLDLPMEKEKKIGEDFSYFTAGVVILGDVIHKSVPKGLVSYAEEKLFKPLNITNYKWQYTPQKVGNTAGGIQLRAIDFAKYGQLYKNKGMWNGKQILTKEWVDKSLSKQVSQINAGIENGYYGYLFWNKEYKVEGKSYEVSFCSGRGGNKIFIFKDIPFVVVITSSAYNNPIAHLNADKIVKEYILPAVIEKK